MKRLFSHFKPLNRLERLRRKWREENPQPSVLSALTDCSLSLEDQRISELNFLVLDFETTGLSPEKDQILSIGYVEINGGVLDLETSHETYIKDSCGIKAETAIINHITPEMLKVGETLDCAMTALFERMKGRVVVVHGLTVEKSFINHYIQSRYGLMPPPLLLLDTLIIEKSLAVNINNQKGGDYRLSSIRQRHGLPEYPCHGALIDAVATGELLLALMKKMFGTGAPTLGQIYDSCHYEMMVNS